MARAEAAAQPFCLAVVQPAGPGLFWQLGVCAALKELGLLRHLHGGSSGALASGVLSLIRARPCETSVELVDWLPLTAGLRQTREAMLQILRSETVTHAIASYQSELGRASTEAKDREDPLLTFTVQYALETPEGLEMQFNTFTGTSTQHGLTVAIARSSCIPCVGWGSESDPRGRCLDPLNIVPSDLLACGLLCVDSDSETIKLAPSVPLSQRCARDVLVVLEVQAPLARAPLLLAKVLRGALFERSFSWGTMARATVQDGRAVVTDRVAGWIRGLHDEIAQTPPTGEECWQALGELPGDAPVEILFRPGPPLSGCNAWAFRRKPPQDAPTNGEARRSRFRECCRRLWYSAAVRDVLVRCMASPFARALVASGLVFTQRVLPAAVVFAALRYFSALLRAALARPRIRAP
jgi:hypothetical protein